MEYISFINHFWSLNQCERFTMAEITLYFYLLNEANSRYWQMPISCATAIVCASIGMSKATLIRAREALKKRGLIEYSIGKQNSRAPTYRLCSVVTDVETAHDTVHVTARATHNKDQNKEDLHNTARVSLDVLEKVLIGDINWQNQIKNQLKGNNNFPPDDLTPFICSFFNELRIAGVSEKEKSDCRSLFYYRQRKECQNRNRNKYDNNKRSIEVGTFPPKAYKESF